MKPRILVTSAAGHTGAPAVLELLEKGFSVRAFVRRHDKRAELLANAGAELFVGNQLDMRDLRTALRGVQRAYHCPPFGPNALQSAALFGVAAEEAELEAVALMNAWNPNPVHPALHQREQWLAEQIYQWMPNVGVIHLNPGMFAFTYFFGLSAVVHFGQLMLPFGEGRNAPPASEDIAAVVAAVLEDPAPHVGKHYRPTGSRLLCGHDVAEAFEQVLERPVRYRDVPTGMFLKAALAQGFSRFEVSQIRRYAEEARRGVYELGAPTNHVEDICGRPPEAFEVTAERYIKHPQRVWARLSVGSRAGAVAQLVRTILTRVPDLDRWEREQGFPEVRDSLLAHESDEWRSQHEPGSPESLFGHQPA